MARSSSEVLHLPMTEQSGNVVEDVTRWGNNGTIVGGVTWPGLGMKFNGVDGFLDCGNDASLDVTDAVTIGAWVKPDTNVDMDIITKLVSIGNQRSFEVGITTNKLCFRVSSDGLGVYTSIISDSTVNEGGWHYCIVVYDGAYLYTHVDGVSDATPVAFSANIFNSTTSVKVGWHYNWNYFDGIIDDPLVLNRALSAEEVRMYFESTKHKYL